MSCFRRTSGPSGPRRRGPGLTWAVLILPLLPLVLLLATSSPAHAHAVLLRADPSDGAVLALAPSAVRLVFNEPVDAVGPGLRVFTADGTRVDLGHPPERADVTATDRTVLATALPDDLGAGGYVITWRVRSADGHAIAGTSRFTVGDAAPVSDDVAAALADADAPALVRLADRLARGAMLLGLLVAAGTAIAGLAVARTTPQRRSAARVTLRSAGATLLLVPVVLWLQGAVQAGATGWGAVSGVLSGDTASTAAIVRGTGLVLLVLVARRSLRDEHAASPAVLTLPAAALALLPLASEGHQRGAALLPGLDTIHLSAGAVWIGAVLLLALAVTAQGGTVNPGTDDVDRLADRVGRTALAALAAVTLAGLAQAVLLLDGPRSLVSTAYGATLSAKVALVVAAVGAAQLARRRARRTGGWQRARGLLRVELALLAAVVLATGALITLPPPVDAQVDLFTSSAPLDDGLVLDVGVDGSRPGRTELHLYVIEDGALTGRSLDVRAVLTSVPDGIGPFRVSPLLVEPGHWFAALEPLPAGDWSLEVTVGLDRFTARTTTFTVPLR